MTRMRLAYLCLDRGVVLPGTSGSSVHVLELIRALGGRGIGVHLLAAGLDPSDTNLPCAVTRLDDEPVLQALHTKLSKLRRGPRATTTPVAELGELLNNQLVAEALTRLPQPVDVVYERLSLWSFAGLQYARRRGIPFVLEVNAPLVEQQAAYRELALADVASGIEELLLGAADRVLVTSPALRDYCTRRGASGRVVRIVPCGVAPAYLQGKRPLGTRRADDFVLAFVGSLKPWHGIEVLLEAFRELSSRAAGYRLLVIGEGPLRARVEQFCEQYGLSEQVRLTGAVAHAQVGTLLAQADIGIAPYPPLDSFYFSPLKIWEYAAVGLPIVASASGHLPELFPHKQAALLHPAGNVRKLVKHVELLRSNPDLAERLARRARRTARLHTWDRLAARVETVLRQLRPPSVSAATTP